MEEQKNYRFAAAYIRVSTEDQADLSPDAQLRQIKNYAAANHLVLDPKHIYIDEGISGRQASKRPAFLSMIAAAKSQSHPFDVILVHKFDRFARSREDSIVYKSLLAKCNVSVVSITESFDDGGSGMGMLMEAITEAYAEFYSVNLSREVKKGMTEKALRGGLQSSPSYGYRMENHRLVPNPPEDQYVRQLFRRFADGDATFALAKWLNAEGQRTHRGKNFENRTVEYILRNPVYIGKLRWNPTGRSRRNFDDPNIIVSDADHQPLVDQELFDQVQKRMAAVKAQWTYHKKPASERKHWLCGIVRCANCGATLIWSNPHYLKCNNYVRGKCTTTQHISAERMEEAFLNQLRLDAQPGSRPMYAISQADPQQRSAVDSIQQQIQQTQRKLDRVRDAFLSGVDTLEEYAAAKSSLTKILDDLKQQLSEAQKTPSQELAADMLRTNLRETLKCLEAPDRTIAQKHESALQLIESCIFNRSQNTITITYRVFI